MKLKSVWAHLKETINGFHQDRVLRLAAATAYYSVFSIGPLLVLIVGLAGVAFGEENVRKEVTVQAQSILGQKSANVISSMMTVQRSGDSLIATIIGGVALLLGATGVFGQLQDSLNTIWGVTTKPGASLGAFIRDRFFSMAMVLGIGFLLLVSLVLSAALSAAGKYFSGLAPGLTVFWSVVDIAFSLLVITALFAMIFKVLPDVKIAWRDVWVGAGLTALLFTIGKFLLGLYLGKNSTVSAYGAAGSLVLILLWVYYSAQIMFFGAEFTRVYANRFGMKMEPKAHARWVVAPTKEARKEEMAKASAKAPKHTPERKKQATSKKEQLVGELQEEVDHLRELVER